MSWYCHVIKKKIEKKKSASKCKRVASLKPTTSPIKALKEVMGYLDIP